METFSAGLAMHETMLYLEAEDAEAARAAVAEAWNIDVSLVCIW